MAANLNDQHGRHRSSILASGLRKRGTPMLPVWAYVIVALAIAVTAFGIGQLVPGLGMVFTAFASTLWVAYSVARQRRFNRAH
jgi:hypothetical protein